MLKVYINGVGYKSSNDYEIVEKAGNKTSSKVTVLVENQMIPASGDIVEVFDAVNSKNIFYGTCGIPTSPTYTSLDEPKVYGIVCGNGNSILDNRIANIAVQDKTIAEIARLLFDTYISIEGIQLGYISDIDVKLTTYTASNYNLRESLNELANLVNAVWEITPDKTFNFIVWDDFPVFPHVISKQFLLGAELKHKTRDYNVRTVQIVAGATDVTDPQLEGFVYDGEQKEFTTVFPVSAKPIIWVNGKEVPTNRIGVNGLDDNNDNMVFLFSYNSTEINYVERTNYLKKNDAVTIQYIGIFSVRAVVRNNEKINEIAQKTGTSGIIERVYLANNVRTSADAHSLAKSLLSQFEEKEGEITFWLTLEQLQSLGMNLGHVALLTLLKFDLPEIGVVGDYVIAERKITPFQLDEGIESYRISLKLADRNILKSYGQIVRNLERDVAQLSIREDEIVVSSEHLAEEQRHAEDYTLGNDIAYYVCSGIYENSLVAPLDFGHTAYTT